MTRKQGKYGSFWISLQVKERKRVKLDLRNEIADYSREKHAKKRVT
jgi:hypothetical protein